MTVWEKLKYNLQSQGMMTKILIVNLAIFLLLNLVANITHLNLTPYVALPIGGYSFLPKFWTLFTYMFSHENFGHFFFNMLLLYFTVQTFYQIIGEKTLLYVYVMSGICGGVLLIILGMFLPSAFAGNLLIGASASILGVVMTIAAYAPNLPVSVFGIINTKYKYVAMFIFLTSTLIDLSINTGGKISHIGGAFFGLIYGLNLRKGTDLLNFAFFTKRKSKLKVVSYQTIEDKYNHRKVNEEEQLNELLEKISKSGYDSLTKSEKETLFKVSQKK
jgi:membrane associated rhomboid family serine protease